MGASSSKKKKDKKGDIADAAEGATSSITKAIEDTSSAVTTKIETTTKTVTDAIDNTTKGLTGAAEESTEGASKGAETAAGGLSSTFSHLRESAERTTQHLADSSQKVIEDVTTTVSATSEAVKVKVEATEKQIEEKSAELAKGLKTAEESLEKGVADINEKIQSVNTNIQKTTEDVKKTVDSNVGLLKSHAETAEGKVKARAAATGDTVKSNLKDLNEKGSAAAKNLEDSGKELAGNLENQASEAKKAAESKAASARLSAEAKAIELSESARKKGEEVKGSAEARAAELKAATDELTALADAKAAEAKAAADTKATEVKAAADKKAAELKAAADTKAAEAKTQAEQLKTQTESQAADLQKAAQDKAGEAKSQGEAAKGSLQGATEGLKSALTGAVGAASGAAHKTVETVGQSLSKATDNVSSSLTGAVSQVSGSVTAAAGNAVSGILDKAGQVGSGLALGAFSLNKMASDAVGGLLAANAVTVCKEDDLKDGEMKVFKISEEGSVLLVRENGQFSALGTKCPHYGAPLAKGVLYNGTVRCPWHGACFRVSTGDIEDSPGLDSIPCYQVCVEDGEVKVSAPSDSVKQNIRSRVLTRRDEQDQRTFVIIGGGGAGESCAESLRQFGYSGGLVVLTKESDLPYDRPKLSKALSSTGKEIALRSQDYFKNGDIEFFFNHEVTSVDVEKKVITCSNDATFNFDKLLVASGGRPVELDVPGKDLRNICYLRTPADANKIADLARDRNAVVVGTSFIGMEVASYLNCKAKSVTVIGRSKTPFVNVFGDKVGERLKKLYLEKGIQFETETGVSEFVGEGGALTGVKLKNGELLPADLCVIGIGVKPTTEFLKGSGILTEKGLIAVDETMKSKVDHVFGAGDIVEFPLPLFGEEKANIGHWQIAQTQGRTAALSMLGIQKKQPCVPFFWCAMLGKSIRYAGYGAGVDDFILDGDLQHFKFVLYACSGDKVVAVVTMASDPVASYFASYVGSGKTLSKSQIQSDPKGWIDMASSSC